MAHTAKYWLGWILFFFRSFVIHGLERQCPAESPVHPTNQKEIRLIIYTTAVGTEVEKTRNFVKSTIENVPLFVDGDKPLLFVELKFGLWAQTVDGHLQCGRDHNLPCLEDQKHTCALTKITHFPDRFVYYRCFVASLTADQCAQQQNIILDDDCVKKAADQLLRNYEEAKKSSPPNIASSPHQVFNGEFDDCTALQVEKDFHTHVCQMYAQPPQTCPLHTPVYKI